MKELFIEKLLGLGVNVNESDIELIEEGCYKPETNEMSIGSLYFEESTGKTYYLSETDLSKMCVEFEGNTEIIEL